MTIYIGADHRGFELKNKLFEWLKEQGHNVTDCGNTEYDAEDDYVDFANAVAKNVRENMMKTGGTPGGRPDSAQTANAASTGGTRAGQDPSESFGILICGSGIGVCAAANRHRGVICGLGFDADQIKHARQNDHINVLSIPSDYVDFEKAKEFVTVFLEAEPVMKEKYLRRARKLDA